MTDQLNQAAPDTPLIFFRPGEFERLVSLLEEGNSGTALHMLNELATRDERCVHTVTHEHGWGVTTYIVVGAATPNPYAVVGDSWEGAHKNESLSADGPGDLRAVGRSEAFVVPDGVCPRCLRPMNTELLTHPPEAGAHDECPDCSLCMKCCPSRRGDIEGEGAEVVESYEI
jgi:hypothetical protein